jgi:Rrf2 family protein
LQILNKKRILKSYKGLGGGFALSQESKKIYLLNIIKAFQGKLQLNECLFKKMACPNKSTCYLKKKIRAIEQNVIRDLESITISSLSR